MVFSNQEGLLLLLSATIVTMEGFIDYTLTQTPIPFMMKISPEPIFATFHDS